jgi:hypothetical protein
MITGPRTPVVAASLQPHKLRDTLLRAAPVCSRGLRLLLHLAQHPDHEGQQLLQRVKARHLAGDQMLDPAVIA